jgi:hypothetical protein
VKRVLSDRKRDGQSSLVRADYQPEPLTPWQPTPRKRTPREEHGGYRVEAYRNSRWWQVVDPAGELVCLTVCKRGAREVARRLAA